MPKGMEEVSGDSVKQMLKKFIQNEDKKKPLSDQKLVKKLEEEGVQISRRTVAKIQDADGNSRCIRQKSRVNCESELLAELIPFLGVVTSDTVSHAYNSFSESLARYLSNF